MSIWQFRLKKTTALKTQIKEEGDNKITINVGKDFEHYYDLKSESGKRKFLEEIQKTKSGSGLQYDRFGREAIDQFKKSLDRSGLDRTHTVNFRNH